MKRRANRVVRDDRPECPTCAARFDVKPGVRIRCGECGEVFTAQRKAHRWESGIGQFIDRVKVGAASRSRADIDVSADWGDDSGDTILATGMKECRIVYLRGGNCFRRAFLNACLQAQCEPISIDGEIIAEAGLNPDTGKWDAAQRDPETGTQYLIAIRRDPALKPDEPNPELERILNVTATARSGAKPQTAIVNSHRQLSVRVPGAGTGQGPDKIQTRPPSPFGSKAQVKATAEALRGYEAARKREAVKAGNI